MVTSRSFSRKIIDCQNRICRSKMKPIYSISLTEIEPIDLLCMSKLLISTSTFGFFHNSIFNKHANKQKQTDSSYLCCSEKVSLNFHLSINERQFTMLLSPSYLINHLWKSVLMFSCRVIIEVAQVKIWSDLLQWQNKWWRYSLWTISSEKS